MPYEEFLGWCKYFKERPPGWADDQRTYMLLAAWGVKEKPENLFHSLKTLKQAQNQRVNSPFEYFKRLAAASDTWNPVIED